jgi:hypothetical protein
MHQNRGGTHVYRHCDGCSAHATTAYTLQKLHEDPRTCLRICADICEARVLPHRTLPQHFIQTDQKIPQTPPRTALHACSPLARHSGLVEDNLAPFLSN